jgi:hypothetical protein
MYMALPRRRQGMATNVLKGDKNGNAKCNLLSVLFNASQ